MTRYPIRRSSRPAFDANAFKNRPLLAGRSNNKYHSIETPYGGLVFHSGKEASYARTLDALKRAARPDERVTRWIPQVNIDLVVNGKKVCRIIPDFEVHFADGHVEIHEVKSPATKTHVWWVKWKLLQALYPNRVYKVIE